MDIANPSVLPVWVPWAHKDSSSMLADLFIVCHEQSWGAHRAKPTRLKYQAGPREHFCLLLHHCRDEGTSSWQATLFPYPSLQSPKPPVASLCPHHALEPKSPPPYAVDRHVLVPSSTIMAVDFHKHRDSPRVFSACPWAACLSSDSALLSHAP